LKNIRTPIDNKVEVLKVSQQWQKWTCLLLVNASW
jgi:hypothetical protein